MTSRNQSLPGSQQGDPGYEVVVSLVCNFVFSYRRFDLTKDFQDVCYQGRSEGVLVGGGGGGGCNAVIYLILHYCKNLPENINPPSFADCNVVVHFLPCTVFT